MNIDRRKFGIADLSYNENRIVSKGGDVYFYHRATGRDICYTAIDPPRLSPGDAVWLYDRNDYSFTPAIVVRKYENEFAYEIAFFWKPCPDYWDPSLEKIHEEDS